MVKARQDNINDAVNRMANGLPAAASKQESTGFTGRCRYVKDRVRRLPWCVPETHTSGLPSWSSVDVIWKAGCGESRTSGLEWGKDREVLPITTSKVREWGLPEPSPPSMRWSQNDQ